MESHGPRAATETSEIRHALTVMADAAQRETQRRETRAGLGLVSCLVPLRALEYLRRFLYKRTPALRMGNAWDPTTPETVNTLSRPRYRLTKRWPLQNQKLPDRPSLMCTSVIRRAPGLRGAIPSDRRPTFHNRIVSGPSQRRADEPFADRRGGGVNRPRTSHPPAPPPHLSFTGGRRFNRRWGVEKCFCACFDSLKDQGERARAGRVAHLHLERPWPEPVSAGDLR